MSNIDWLISYIFGFLLGASTMIMGTPIEEIRGWSAKIIWVILNIMSIAALLYSFIHYVAI